MIGSHEPIVAVQGDDVILPCHVEPRVSMVRYTVEWSRPDLKPDPNDRLSRVEYVHLYRDSREVPDMKISSYVKRTALFAEGLIHGNISLKIINVTLEDRGRYKCFIPKLKGSTEQFSIVHLVVGEFICYFFSVQCFIDSEGLSTGAGSGLRQEGKKISVCEDVGRNDS